MPKIPLGLSAASTPPEPSTNSSTPVPAIPLTEQELISLGLNEPVVQAPLHGSHPRPQDKIAAFVERVAPAAAEAADQLGVPVEAVISQWALESGWGGSELASKYNNLGGIKAYGGWKGQTVNMPSYEKDRSVKEVSPFRVYPTVEDYARDYTNFLGSKRYQSVHGTNDVRSFALALGNAGYHQDDPAAYANQLESIARRIGPLLVKNQ